MVSRINDVARRINDVAWRINDGSRGRLDGSRDRPGGYLTWQHARGALYVPGNANMDPFSGIWPCPLSNVQDKTDPAWPRRPPIRRVPECPYFMEYP